MSHWNNTPQEHLIQAALQLVRAMPKVAAISTQAHLVVVDVEMDLRIALERNKPGITCSKN